MPVLITFLIIATGCHEQVDKIDNAWKPPIHIADSLNMLVGSVKLFKSNNSILAVGPFEDGSIQCYRLNQSNNNWLESSGLTIPKGYMFWGTVGRQENELIFQDVFDTNQNQVIKILIATLSDDMKFNDLRETTIAEDKKALFGETGTNVQLGDLFEGPGVIDDSDICLPFFSHGITRRGNTTYDDEGPFNDSMLHSTDSGKTWEMEQIDRSEGFDPSLSKTAGYYYYIAPKRADGCYLWFSRKPTSGETWEAPKLITKTYSSTDGHYVTKTEGDRIHICWVDRRYNKIRLNIDGPNIENDVIAYRRRSDSNGDWSKDIILSKGLLYSYSPSMSVEGSNIVVAWAGIQSAGKYHVEYDANDIYYVTSKDSGQTWSNPLKVTDKAKDGIDSGTPQVMLFNGIIHLFYTQGQFEKPDPLSPLPSIQSWPILYTDRQFPN